MATISIGDKCMWRGAWGTEEPKEATIDGIEKGTYKNAKYGTPVKKVDEAEKDFCVFDLDNGHWAYGCQIEPIKE